ncbi:MAG: 4'-phosphopantetheinyl transferase superfamily protein [Candidatus Pacearchaeota archaeon]
MIKAGIDLVLNKRLKKNLNNESFLKKVFHPTELKHPKQKLPGIFALKEATMKALGKKLDWLDIEISAKSGRKPKIFLSETIKPKNLKSVDASLSHDGDYTIGIVVIDLN